MKRNLFLAIAATVSTVVVTLVLIRALAPQLLGGPTDLQLVQLDERLPSFFKGVFRDEHNNSRAFLLKDPLTRVRAMPFYKDLKGMGPNDVLGFRNAAVPVVADIVTIGDSMTYGNNAVMLKNWPSWMKAHLPRDNISVYNMSTGGWAAIQYLDMLEYAASFRPHVVIVAFYTGNDPVESFQMVHGNEHWSWLMDTRDISMEGLPEFSMRVPETEKWHVKFRDGVSTVFTPQLRDISNTDHPAVDAGYEIMSVVAGKISERARELGIKVLFTIIPTKELVYNDKVMAEGLDAPVAYKQLVDHESSRITRLSGTLESLPGAAYVDVIKPMQRAALNNVGLYVDNTLSGHPDEDGYRVIGQSVAAAAADLIPVQQTGLFVVRRDKAYYFVLVKDEGAWYFKSSHLVEKNGWQLVDVPVIGESQLLRLPVKGVIGEIDPQRFGPGCCSNEIAQLVGREAEPE